VIVLFHLAIGKIKRLDPRLGGGSPLYKEHNYKKVHLSMCLCFVWYCLCHFYALVLESNNVCVCLFTIPQAIVTLHHPTMPIPEQWDFTKDSQDLDDGEEE
jgi:hypothetical protein